MYFVTFQRTLQVSTYRGQRILTWSQETVFLHECRDDVTKFLNLFYGACLLGIFYYFSFIFPLAICSSCRIKHKADTNFTLFAPEEECTKTHAAEKTYKLIYV